MAVDTDWHPGSKVTMALTDQWRLTGQVLAAERPRSGQDKFFTLVGDRRQRTCSPVPPASEGKVT